MIGFPEDDFAKVMDIYSATAEIIKRPEYREIRQHTRGRYAIMYTKLQVRPKTMLVGLNPSVFDDSDPVRADDVIRKLMMGPPDYNSYTTDNHLYARKLQGVFCRLGCRDLLETCVGMNVFHFQYTDLKGLKGLHDFEPLMKFCVKNTRSIIKMVNPERLLVCGGEAQKALGFERGGIWQDIQVCPVVHPCQREGLAKLDESFRRALGLAIPEAV